MSLLFLSSGLFLGWSLGANDAANVFGTAVGSRMLKFSTAALVCSIFVTLGAVLSGSGASHTLGKLGAVDAIAGAFMVAFSAGFTVFWMSRLKLPVSTSQAIVGAIIGWNYYAGALTDYNALTKIVSTWVLCPVLAAIFSIFFFTLFRVSIRRTRIHMLKLDKIMRMSLLLAGAFGAYNLGANNIANVMGVFVPVAPFQDFVFFDGMVFTGTQQLFLIGGLAISVGVYTYSRKVMETVGNSLFRLSPEAAFVVVLANAFVLFVFSSVWLQQAITSVGLPAIPLVPVSSTQAVVGAVLGIGLLKRAHGVNFSILGQIASGWVTTPIISCLITFVALFFLQNVFNQEVHRERRFKVARSVVQHLHLQGFRDTAWNSIGDVMFHSEMSLDMALAETCSLTARERKSLIQASEMVEIFVDPKIVAKMDRVSLTDNEWRMLKKISGKRFDYTWQFQQALAPWTELDPGENKARQQAKLDRLIETFQK